MPIVEYRDGALLLCQGTAAGGYSFDVKDGRLDGVHQVAPR